LSRLKGVPLKIGELVNWELVIHSPIKEIFNSPTKKAEIIPNEQECQPLLLVHLIRVMPA
jgi:hypothetical protein